MKLSLLLKPLTVLAAEVFKAWNRYHSPQSQWQRAKDKITKLTLEKAKIYEKLSRVRKQMQKDPNNLSLGDLAGRLDTQLLKKHKRIADLERRYKL